MNSIALTPIRDLSPAKYRTLFLVLALLLANFSLAFPTQAAQPGSRDLNGFKVEGRFLEVWERQGSEQNNVYVNGLPITARRSELSLVDGKTYETQWFERARFEAHPEYAPPNEVLLGLLGASLIEGRGAIDPSTGKVRNPNDAPFLGVSKPEDTDGTSKVWFPETRHTVSGKILEYWNKYGGLAQFGYPLSEPFREISSHDGNLYEVQYFERNRFELHPEKRPPYEVELGLLGVQQYRLSPVPVVTLPISPPPDITSAKDTLTLAMSQAPASLVPEFNGSYASQVASRPLFLRVIASDPAGNLYPELAQYVPTLENGGAFYSGEGDDRQLTLKLKLRRGVVWSDGAEVTTRDLVLYHRLMLEPRAPVAAQYRTVHLKLDTLEAPDPYTLLARYLSTAQASKLLSDPTQARRYAFLKPYVEDKRPVTDPAYNLAIGALPEHVLAKMPPERIGQSDFVLQPIVNGPYMVENKDWRNAARLSLVPNPKYNLAAPPVLRRINIRVISDAAQAARLVAVGEIDAATRDIFTGADRLGSYSSALDMLLVGGHHLEVVPSLTGDFLSFNLERGAFKDKRVRHAIAHAINRPRIVERYWFNKSHVLNAFVPPTLWASSVNPAFAQKWSPTYTFKQYPYDPDRAAQLMQEAGYTRDRDGYRYREGARLIVELSWATRGAGLRATDIAQLQEDLRALGIEVRSKAVPPSFFFATGGYLAQGEHDLALYTLSVGSDPLDALGQYISNQVPTEENGLVGKNYSGFRNARYDELLGLASHEWEPAKLAPLYAEMQALLTEEMPAIPLTSHPILEARSRRLVGWESGWNDVPATYKLGAMYFK
jgi:peptide/nickel transport system substrate-binding protein